MGGTSDLDSRDKKRRILNYDHKQKQLRSKSVGANPLLRGRNGRILNQSSVNALDKRCRRLSGYSVDNNEEDESETVVSSGSQFSRANSSTTSNNYEVTNNLRSRVYTLNLKISCQQLTITKILKYITILAILVGIVIMVVVEKHKIPYSRHVTSKSISAAEHLQNWQQGQANRNGHTSSRYQLRNMLSSSIVGGEGRSDENNLEWYPKGNPLAYQYLNEEEALQSNKHQHQRRQLPGQQQRELPQLNGFNDPKTVEFRDQIPYAKSFDKNAEHDVHVNAWDNLGTASQAGQVVYMGNDGQQQQQVVEGGLEGSVFQQPFNPQVNNELEGGQQQINLEWVDGGTDQVQGWDQQQQQLPPPPPQQPQDDNNDAAWTADEVASALADNVRQPGEQQQGQQFQEEQMPVGQDLNMQQQQQIVASTGQEVGEAVPPSEQYWDAAIADLQNQINQVEAQAGELQQPDPLPLNQQGGVDNFEQPPGHAGDITQGGEMQQAGLAAVDSELIHHPIETMKHLKEEFMNSAEDVGQQQQTAEGGTQFIEGDTTQQVFFPVAHNDDPSPPQATSDSPQLPQVELPATMTSYNIENCFHAVSAFRYTIFFFVYEAKSDSFVVIHNIKGCDFGCQRIFRVASVISYGLRKHMPDRFQGQESDDLVLMISTGDAPRVKNSCLGVGPSASENYCGSVDFAPIFQSGSVFVDPKYLPSMIAFPVPVRPHLPCFDEWQIEETLCQDLQPKLDFEDNQVKTGLVYGKELGIITDQNLNLNHGNNYWDHLIPQVIWRGTDFVFLHTLYPEMRGATYSDDIAPKADEIGGLEQFVNEFDKKQWAIQTLWDMSEKLLPRWRGVLMTSEAELEAEQAEKGIDDGNSETGGAGIRSYGDTGKKILPWVNIKFANINDGGKKVPASEHEEYKLLSELGISVIGDYVNMIEQAKYKYHIDLGGGGGTTWTVSISLSSHLFNNKSYNFQLTSQLYLLPPLLTTGYD